MIPLSYSRHRFPPPVIQHSIWLYLRFTLSYRDVEDLLARVRGWQEWLESREGAMPDWPAVRVLDWEAVA